MPSDPYLNVFAGDPDREPPANPRPGVVDDAWWGSQFTAEQRAAYERGVAMANAVPEPSHNDGRIALDDVVSFRCPPFLTADYDPTHRANIR